MTVDIFDILGNVAREEQNLNSSEFFAPCVPGARVQTRIGGLIYTFTPSPADFEGWGIFLPEDHKIATLAGEVDQEKTLEYLSKLSSLQLRLSHRLHGKTWLAYPVNQEEAKKRYQVNQPVLLHLVAETTGRFDTVIARFDGTSWWYEQKAPKQKLFYTETLREAFANKIPSSSLQFSGLTPEMRVTYRIAISKEKLLLKTPKNSSEQNSLPEWQLTWSDPKGLFHSFYISLQNVVSVGMPTQKK